MRVLAVDPGGTTGMALWEKGPDFGPGTPSERFESWFEPSPFNAISRAKIEMVGKLDVLVVEEFRISARTVKATRGGSNTAIEVVGALRWLAHVYETVFVEQTPGDAKTFLTDEKLRRLGWYTKGPDHARDAARHLALFLARQRYIEPNRLVG